MRNYLPAGILVSCLANCISAQPPGAGVRPAARPTFSPYLNLNRAGTSAAINYYGLVRPQVTYNSAIQQLQQTTQDLQQREPVVVGMELPPTGHATGFLSHSKYFLNRGGATPLSFRSAAAPSLQSLPRPGTTSAR
jgi:hypothetical protein